MLHKTVHYNYTDSVNNIYITGTNFISLKKYTKETTKITLQFTSPLRKPQFVILNYFEGILLFYNYFEEILK